MKSDANVHKNKAPRLFPGSSLRSAAAFVQGKQGQKIKLALLGKHTNDGWIARILIYLVLFVVAFLYLQPLLYIVTTMFKSLSDLIDPTVNYLPRDWNLDNIVKAWRGLKYPQAFTSTLTIALGCSIFQVFVCAVTGYALARLHFPGRNLLFFLVMVTFLIPPQVYVIPLFVIYGKLGLINTPFVFLIPALLGQGLRSALFIIIFRQFFIGQPQALVEAAKLDGASAFRLFWRIMLPLSSSACVVVFLFSFIWYWNMYYEASMFLSGSFTPLSIRLDNLELVLTGNQFNALNIQLNPVTEGAKMAAAFLILLPPSLVYMAAQRWFTEGIERTGLVE
ncbi:carbohydrate ABC transporter permease [Paenibacillus nasutitermitis]|uniref:ABC transporter permease n=1 Tax=Paenibacillus nasutitermitis TaxID=1652958 RepID=A0A916YRJ2_9BACL|nr:carbohydrate ABC transporter permease [Paenibacillus nasutitermitis]GGD57289.1 ABC transporter permease [Paenibacillus nasutitermitis]